MVVDAAFPKPTAPVDEVLSASAQYIRRTIKSIRDAEAATQKQKKKGKAPEVTFNPNAPKSLKVYVATKFPEWQEECVLALKSNYDQVKHLKIKVVVGRAKMILWLIWFSFDRPRVSLTMSRFVKSLVQRVFSRTRRLCHSYKNKR